MSESSEDISALLDGELPPDEAAAVEARLAASASAQAERDALGHVVEQVRGLARVAPPAHFLAAVMAGVIEARAEDAPARAEPHKGASSRLAKTRDEPRPGASSRLAKTRDEPRPGAASGRLGRGGGDVLACGVPAEDVTAFMDQALPPERQAEVAAKLGGSAPCHARLVEMQRVRDRVRGLPRLKPGELFTRQVMARLDEAIVALPAPAPAPAAEAAPVDPAQAEARARARSEARASFWRASGWFAQAAGVLLSIGVGLGLTAPPGTSWVSMPAARLDQVEKLVARSSPAGMADGAPGASATDAPFAPEAIDCRLEFRAKTSSAGYQVALERALATGQAQLDGRFQRAPQGDGGPADIVVTLAANQVDDVALAIDAAADVDATDETRDALPRLTIEQDRVVLKSGFVLAGRVEAEDGNQVVVVAGDLRQAVPRRLVERVERADRPRRVWIAVRGEAAR